VYCLISFIVLKVISIRIIYAKLSNSHPDYYTNKPKIEQKRSTFENYAAALNEEDFFGLRATFSTGLLCFRIF
jgi:hypothetical protein